MGRFCTGLGGVTLKQASTSFLKKRSKRLLSPLSRDSRPEPAKFQKFFGSFFQKRTACLPSSPNVTALRCIFLLCAHHGTILKPEDLASAAGISVPRILAGHGLQVKTLQHTTFETAAALGNAYPALALLHDGNWLLVAGALGTGADAKLAVLDPARENLGLFLLARDAFAAAWSGTLVLARPKAATQAARRPFGLGWFITEILTHRATLAHVALAAIMSNLIALAAPLLTHVIIDKVIPYRAVHTLAAVLLIYLAVIVFDGLFGYVRQRLMTFVSTQVDARVASHVFAHLLSLPMGFFEATTAGVLTRHLQQTDKLRQFLTGRLFQTLLDCTTLPVLLVLLASYSLQLFAVVGFFTLAVAAVIGVLIPTFRHRLAGLYGAEAARQAQLVETIQGMRTIKSLAMEPVRQAAWDGAIARALSNHNAVGRVATSAHVATSGLDRLMQLAILGLGAHAVFTGALSVGALVAFTMLSARVSGPLLQVVALINEYQETALSARMLATVMDAAPERAPEAASVSPPITGALTFEGVSFRYPGAAAPALDQVSFEVAEGQVIGVVGRSGSGKTTLIRLLQAIEPVQAGMIRLGGTDIRHIGLPHLRRHVGVVLQESFLFRGSIHANIAASCPSAPLAEVMEAACLAGADEFIDRLPLGYDTVIEEGASNLSGGQRQRLSIARALLTRPRLLIFDEATSALDPESEAILQANLRRIAHGRTMIVVSHRLSSLCGADAILVLGRGRVLDFAPHAVLLARCEAYRSLWQQQTAYLQPMRGAA